MKYLDQNGDVWEVPTDLLINEEGRLLTFDEVASFFGPLELVEEAW